jgi:hypothetical protein
MRATCPPTSFSLPELHEDTNLWSFIIPVAVTQAIFFQCEMVWTRFFVVIVNVDGWDYVSELRPLVGLLLIS